MSKARGLADLGNVYDDGALSNRCMTYNGAMNVWQRGTSDDTASSGDYTCDRWNLQFAGLDGNVDWDQETSSTPDGFAYALKVSTDASETSLDSLDYLKVSQRFEGQDLQHLQKGTLGAKSLTLSFWVKSSVASTYTIEIEDRDNSRGISKSYTIDTADTWEYKSVVFEGDTSSPYTNDANESLRMSFYLDSGSGYTTGTFSTVWSSTADVDERIYDTTGWLESSSPEFYLTGVQLEIGDTATAFEHRSYGDELARCQRYYYKRERTGSSDPYVGIGQAVSSAATYVFIQHPVQMRAQPTFYKNGNMVLNNGTARTASNVSSSGIGLIDGVLNVNCGSGLSSNQAVRCYFQSNGHYYSMDAEL